MAYVEAWRKVPKLNSVIFQADLPHFRPSADHRKTAEQNEQQTGEHQDALKHIVVEYCESELIRLIRFHEC